MTAIAGGKPPTLVASILGLFTNHQWPTRPLVTLEQELVWGEVKWGAGPTAHSFTPNFMNSVVVQVQFRWKNPYGGHANYKVVIDQASGSVWSNVITDTAQFLTDRPDDIWHYGLQDYQLHTKPGVTQLRFRVGVSIEVGGAGSFEEDEGSAGSWLPLQYREYTASFPRQVKPKQLESYLEILNHYYSRSSDEYKRRFKLPKAR